MIKKPILVILVCLITYLPFAPCAASNKKFDPEKGYWRGPVWLDQAAFAIEGMRKNKFNKQADQMFEALTVRAEGMLNDGALKENYNSINGKGQPGFVMELNGK